MCWCTKVVCWSNRSYVLIQPKMCVDPIKVAHGETCRTRNVCWDLPCAVNNQLRTGADKGNPIVQLKQSIAMASKGVDAVWCLLSALNAKVMKLKQSRVNGGVIMTPTVVVCCSNRNCVLIQAKLCVDPPKWTMCADPLKWCVDPTKVVCWPNQSCVLIQPKLCVDPPTFVLIH